MTEFAKDTVMSLANFFEKIVILRAFRVLFALQLYDNRVEYKYRKTLFQDFEGGLNDEIRRD